MIAVTRFVHSQNLVYNGSFEEYTACPTGNELNNGQFERAVGWWRPTDCTPDYFNQCNNGVVDIPNNFWGHQEAFHGNAYVGFIPVVDGLGVFEYEYFRTQLISALKPCFKYRFRMYVSLANYSTHGIKNIGAYFTLENEFQSECDLLNIMPQVKHIGNPIVDTMNWTKIEGTFIAKGNEQFLSIGYYQQNINDDTVFVQQMGSFYLHPYIYVDSVSLFEIGAVSEDICESGEITFPNIISPNNDGSNDYLDVTPYFTITDKITVMNRWGNIITYLTKEQPIWDGTTSCGTPCVEGNYFYIFSYQWGKQIKDKSGFIQLVR